jgi:thiol-disulfide isomerase/thioredoxin
MIQTLLGEDTQYLTNDEELRSYFVEEFKKRAGEEDDKRSWDVQYINLLNTLEREQDEALEKAKEIAKRTRIRRTKPKAQKGVLIFGKKGKDHVFKLSDGTNKPIALTTEDAIKLFKADIMEQAEKVSPTFDKIYQELKKTLFKRRTEFKRDKGKQVAIEKIKMMKTKCPWNKDYLEDLKRVAQEYDVLSAWAMKKIRDIDFNNIDQEMAELQNTIKHSFLASKIRQANEIDEGEETVILTEELI